MSDPRRLYDYFLGRAIRVWALLLILGIAIGFLLAWCVKP